MTHGALLVTHRELLESHMARTDPCLVVRLPPDVKEFVAQEAKKNASSQSSEVVRALRERMERDAARQREHSTK
jgi:hypothetical protein